MTTVRDESFTLYRVDWEERTPEDPEVYVSACAYAPSQKPISVDEWGGIEEVRNVSVRPATKEEEDAYQAGFEDGFDVATMQQRLQQYKQEHEQKNGDEPINMEDMLSVFREETSSKESCACGGNCSCK